MKIKYPAFPGREKGQETEAFVLAFVLSQEHPQGLQPSIQTRVSASGKHITELTWSDLSIRIWYVERMEAAVAHSASLVGDCPVSDRPLVYGGMGDSVDPADIKMLFSPTSSEPPFP